MLLTMIEWFHHGFILCDYVCWFKGIIAFQPQCDQRQAHMSHWGVINSVSCGVHVFTFGVAGKLIGFLL